MHHYLITGLAPPPTIITRLVRFFFCSLSRVRVPKRAHRKHRSLQSAIGSSTGVSSGPQWVGADQWVPTGQTPLLCPRLAAYPRRPPGKNRVREGDVKVA